MRRNVRWAAWLKEIAGESLLLRDLVGAATSPGRIGAVSSIERVVNDDLAPLEELDMWSADTLVLDLFVVEPVLRRNDVEGLSHELSIGRWTRRAEAPTPIWRRRIAPAFGGSRSFPGTLDPA
jgi:hypothetical protein